MPRYEHRVGGTVLFIETDLNLAMREIVTLIWAVNETKSSTFIWLVVADCIQLRHHICV